MARSEKKGIKFLKHIIMVILHRDKYDLQVRIKHENHFKESH
jgi:hypothetical protein